LGGDRLIPGVLDLHTDAPRSGNVAAADLVRDGAANPLASDSVPAAMTKVAWRCAAEVGSPLPTVARVGDAPARVMPFHDRCRTAPGLRADFMRMRVYKDLPAVRQVWRAGVRVS